MRWSLLIYVIKISKKKYRTAPWLMAVVLPAWLEPCRTAVRETPRYSAPKPSSLMTVYIACAALRYLGTSSGSAIEWCWACSRILTTSIGVTTATASVTPAASPAVYGRKQKQARSVGSSLCHNVRGRHSPTKVLWPDTVPSEEASNCLYHSYDVKRIAIFGTMPVMTAPSPLYSASGVSRLTISDPVLMKPRGFAWSLHEIQYVFVSSPIGGHSEGMKTHWRTYTRCSGSPWQLHADLDCIC